MFHERAAEYDHWYDDSLLFQVELAALKEVKTTLTAPKLEIGVGSGRFAQELNVSFGLDPAFNSLLIAKDRGIEVCRSVGEDLPLQDNSISTIYILFALCFMADPSAVLAECYRVLKRDGHLMIGLISGPSPWGKDLQAKKENNHPFYRHARFYEPAALLDLCHEAGYVTVETRSSLLQEPEKVEQFESSNDGLVDGAGFVVILVRKR